MFFSNDNCTLELLGVFKINRTSINQNSSNARSYDSLSIRLSGYGHFTSPQGSFSVGQGDLLYLPMGAPYHQSTTGETVIAIHFINYAYKDGSKIEKISIDNIDELEDIVIDMYHTWTEKKAGYRYKSTSLLYRILYLSNKKSHINTLYTQSTNSTIKKAVDYIHTHFRKETILISDLASLSAVSETYFRKLFKKVYSISPSQYIMNLRLEYASQLLQSQLYSVLQVSEQSGFNDVKYFSRIFKKHYGISPLKYKYTDIEKHLI